MKKLFVLTLLAIGIITFSQQAHAFNFGAGVGAYIPQGDAADYVDVGYGANAYIDFGIIPLLVDFRIYADYYTAEGTYQGTDLELTAVGGGALIMLKPAMPFVHPYAGIGYAAHNTEFGTKGDTDSELGTGVIVQAGLSFGVLIMDIGIGATYFINDVDFGDSTSDLGGLTVGLTASVGF